MRFHLAFLLLIPVSALLSGCPDSSGDDLFVQTPAVAPVLRGSCAQPSLAAAVTCEEYVRADDDTAALTAACSSVGEFSAALCDMAGSLGVCTLPAGAGGEENRYRFYGTSDDTDTLSEQQARCLAQPGEPVWTVDGEFVASQAYTDNFNDGGDPATNGEYRASGDGCSIVDRQLLCVDTGGSPGKLTYVTSSDAVRQRVRADLHIRGGDYNDASAGLGAPAVLALWLNTDDFGTASDGLLCGLLAGELVIVDIGNGAVEVTGSGTDLATDGSQFNVAFTVELDAGSSAGQALATCAISGDHTESISYELPNPSASYASGYAGLEAGYYDGTSTYSFAYWDNFYFERGSALP